MNVTFDPNGANAITFGSNKNSSTGWMGVQDETTATLQRISANPGAYSFQDVWFSDSQFAAALSFAQNKASQTMQGLNNYSIFCGNCVDFSANVLQYSGQSKFNISNYLQDSTLLDYYAQSVMYFCTNSEMDIMESTAPLASHVYNYAVQNYAAGYFGYGMQTDQVLALMMHLAEQLGDAEFLLDLYSLEATTTEYGQTGSPIAIDLNGDGVRTLGLWESAVQFDISGDKRPEHTAWLSQEDAFLVLDRNRNGTVDGVREMFGGPDRGDGYRELKRLDSNKDGQISSADHRFADLQLWRDANSDGKTDPGELMSLADAGVAEIWLNYVSQEEYDKGNLVGEVSVAIVGGASVQAADVYLAHGV